MAAQEALEDSNHRLKSAEEAQAAAEGELASLRVQKERLEGDLTKQWQEMHAQVSEVGHMLICTSLSYPHWIVPL